jgi:hypothetical protein
MWDFSPFSIYGDLKESKKWKIGSDSITQWFDRPISGKSGRIPLAVAPSGLSVDWDRVPDSLSYWWTETTTWSGE